MAELIVTVTDDGFDDNGEEHNVTIPRDVVDLTDLCETIAAGLLHENGWLPGVIYKWRVVRADEAGEV